MAKLPALRTALVLSFLVVLLTTAAAPKPAPSTSHSGKPDGRPAPEIAIDLDATVAAKLPAPTGDLEPAVFHAADGRKGWVIRIPGGRPIATPAYWDGFLFVGGGYGSHEFYAFDARSGRLAWKLQTTDDGPTAAVVEDGCVAYNTESCTIEVVDARSGRRLWHEWLGDPLMSQPAIAKGRVFMAHPAGQRASQGAQAPSDAAITPQGAANSGNVSQVAPEPSVPRSSHQLLCADLKTGRHFWEADLPADVVTAPVVDGDRVLVTCFDGMSMCLRAADGKVLWRRQQAGTSAPLVARGQVVVTEKHVSGGKTTEGMLRLEASGESRDRELLAAGEADHLAAGARSGTAIEAHEQSLDASVGFGSAPAAAALDKAAGNLNVKSVVGGWAYQGARAAYKDGRLINAQGAYLNSVDAESGRQRWRAHAKGAGVEGGQVFAPPAIGARNLYVCSTRGHVLAVGQRDGAVRFGYDFGQPMAFQPALALGNVYVGTTNGLLLCLETGDPDADGWYAWGGNAQHNKSE
jgi:Ca-activated chloride channel family protein